MTVDSIANCGLDGETEMSNPEIQPASGQQRMRCISWSASRLEHWHLRCQLYHMTNGLETPSWTT